MRAPVSGPLLLSSRELLLTAALLCPRAWGGVVPALAVESEGEQGELRGNEAACAGPRVLLGESPVSAPASCSCGFPGLPGSAEGAGARRSRASGTARSTRRSKRSSKGPLMRPA
jgi:hypothetical protein